jgi:hypothetical protein
MLRRVTLYLFAGSHPCGDLDVGWPKDRSVVEPLNAATIATSAGKNRTIGEKSAMPAAGSFDGSSFGYSYKEAKPCD